MKEVAVYIPEGTRHIFWECIDMLHKSSIPNIHFNIPDQIVETPNCKIYFIKSLGSLAGCRYDAMFGFPEDVVNKRLARDLVDERFEGCLWDYIKREEVLK